MEKRPSPSFLNIFQEATGYYSYARTWGSIFNLSGLGCLGYAIATGSQVAWNSALFLIGVGYGGKILQKPFETKPVIEEIAINNPLTVYEEEDNEQN